MSEGIHEVKFSSNSCKARWPQSSISWCVLILCPLLFRVNYYTLQEEKRLEIWHMFFFYCRLTPSVPFTTRTIDTEMVLGDYVLPEGVSQLIYFITTFDDLSCNHWHFSLKTTLPKDGSQHQGKNFHKLKTIPPCIALDLDNNISVFYFKNFLQTFQLFSEETVTFFSEFILRELHGFRGNCHTFTFAICFFHKQTDSLASSEAIPNADCLCCFVYRQC